MYVQRAFDTLEALGYRISSEDKARVSPLMSEHITFEGRYLFEPEQYRIRLGHSGIWTGFARRSAS